MGCTTDPMPRTSSIAIIGAGISGLTLSRALLARGIPSTIYEKASQPDPRRRGRHDYSITLDAAAWQPLADILHMPKSMLRQAVSVYGTPNDSETEATLRAHRGRLEALLAKDLDIKYDHDLCAASVRSQSPNSAQSFPRPRLSFQKRPSISAPLVIATDGVHSSLRAFLAPTQTLRVLPYVVFRGRRRIKSSIFQTLFAPELKERNVAELRRDGVLLRILVDDTQAGSGPTAEETLISYTYSRHARDGPEGDELYKPSRAVDDARVVPEAFFREIGTLSGLDGPWKYIFDEELLRKDRIQHWLMRSLVFDTQELSRLAQAGVVFLGDAAHATPILGSRGADIAIKDALELAARIEHGHDEGLLFVADRTKDVENAEERLAAMHDMHVQDVPKSIL
jgi:tyrosinase